VILLVAFLALVATVPLLGGKLRNLAELEVRRTGLLLVTTVLQAVITQIDTDGVTAIAAGAHLLSYLIVGAFVWANRTIPWLWLAALGGLMNFLAIAANGGTMPATPDAADAAGIEAESDFANSNVIEDANLWFLGDVFAIPEAWPLSNVFSVGDVVLLVGGGLVVHDVAGSRLVARGRRRGDAPEADGPTASATPAAGGPGAPGGADDEVAGPAGEGEADGATVGARGGGAPDGGAPVGDGAGGARWSGAANRVPLLRDNHDFRRLWLAGASSDLGDWTHALAVIAILAGRGASAGVFAALLIVQMVSSSLVGFLGTPIVDRVDRMRLLGATNFAQAAAVASLLVPDRPSVAHFLVVTALLGGLGALVRPATMASIPNLVRPDQLVAANGFVAAAFNVAVSIGPILGAGLVARWGARPAFTVNVASFLLSAALVARVTRRGVPVAGAGAHALPAPETWLASATAGLRHIARVPALRHLVVVLALVVLGAAVRGPVEPGFIVDVLDGSPGAIGALAGLWGLGMVLGSTVAVTAGRRWSLERVLVGGIGLLGLSIVAASQSGSLEVVAVLWLLAGIGNALGSVAYETLLQQHTSDDRRGRVFGVADALLDATFLVGALAAVAIGAALGERAGIAIGGAGDVLAAAYGTTALLRRRGERHLEVGDVPAHPPPSPGVPHLRSPDATGRPL
jgi:MFS family permease